MTVEAPTSALTRAEANRVGAAGRSSLDRSSSLIMILLKMYVVGGARDVEIGTPNDRMTE